MKFGRPKIPKSERKGKITGVRLTSAERKAVDTAALKEGIKLSKWIRKTLINAAKSTLAFDSEGGTITI
jgi:hypothetical protein